jgi:hypothetical protein
MTLFERLCILATIYVIVSALVLAFLATRPRRRTSARACGRPSRRHPRLPYAAAHRRGPWATDRRTVRQTQRRQVRDGLPGWATQASDTALRRPA